MQISFHAHPINVNATFHLAFVTACEKGSLNDITKVIAMWTPGPSSDHNDQEQFNIHFADEAGFIAACANGHLHVVDHLLSLEKTHGRINIHAKFDSAFETSINTKNKALTAKLICLQHTHGPISGVASLLFAAVTVQTVSPDDIKKALEHHTYKEVRLCLDPVLTHTPDPMLKQALTEILVAKAQTHLGQTKPIRAA